jgi:DNA-directed RNA polymerase specialized sigma24 family protein
MTTEARTVEQMIAEWYATGTCSDECAHEIVRQTEEIAQRVGRTYSPRVADQVRNDAVGHVTAILKRGAASSDSGDAAYDPRRPFAGWCYAVIKKLAIDRYRRKWHRREKPVAAQETEGDPLRSTPDRHGSALTPEPDQNVVAAEMLVQLEQLLPRAADRIIIAVQTGYIDGLPDAVVARWCDDADVTVEVAELRALVDRVGCLKALAAMLNVSYEVVRARSSRAMKDLRAGDFRRAREEFE